MTFLSSFLLIVGQLQVIVCHECFLVYVFRYYCLPCTVSTFHAATSHWQWSLFLYIVSSQVFELSLFTTTLNILFGESRSPFSTGTKVVTAVHCNEHLVAMRTKTINTEAVAFFSVYMLYRSSKFCNLLLLVGNRTRLHFQSYWSCFFDVWISLSLDWDLNAYKVWLALVETMNMDIVGQHQSQ